MVRVAWSRGAIGDLEAIRLYLAQFDRHAADRIHANLKAAGESLARFPHRDRLAGRSFRELMTVRHHIVRYYVDEYDVLITPVRHAARRKGRRA